MSSGEYASGERLPLVRGSIGQQPPYPAEVEDQVADRDTGTRMAARRREDTERQILDREIGMAVRGFDPAQTRRIMRLVDPAHGSFALSNPAQHSS